MEKNEDLKSCWSCGNCTYSRNQKQIEAKDYSYWTCTVCGATITDREMLRKKKKGGK